MLMELMKLKQHGRPRVAKNAARNCGCGSVQVGNPGWTLSQVLLATGGRFVSGQTEAAFRNVSTDSRTVEAGDLFIALTGENFDGHVFIEDAIRKGAAGVVVSHEPEGKLPTTVVLVPDTLKALGDIAAYRRSLMPDLRVIGITGSSGKTSVKEMTAAIFSPVFNILKTRGNFNNLVGLPISLLPVDRYHDFAVLEMGMNRPGEIARLTEIADPDIVCITNIQAAHLAGLSDIKGVAKAKGELFLGVKAWGKLVVNVDDKRVKAIADQCGQEKITFGRSPMAFVRATHIRSIGEEGMAFTLHVGGAKERIQIKSLGVHNVMNSLAAAALAVAAGVGIGQIASGLVEFNPYERRLQIAALHNGVKIINDTYNANPSSVIAALETLQQLHRNCKKVAVLGDMLELGSYSNKAHQLVGESVARLEIDYLLAVGSFAGKTKEGAVKSGMGPNQALVFKDKAEVAKWLHTQMGTGVLTSGDLILVKGSRGMRMETIIADLIAEAA